MFEVPSIFEAKNRFSNFGQDTETFRACPLCLSLCNDFVRVWKFQPANICRQSALNRK